MKKVLSIVIAFSLLLLASYNMPRRTESPSKQVKTITVVDVATGDTIVIEFSGNPGVADKAFKK